MGVLDKEMMVRSIRPLLVIKINLFGVEHCNQQKHTKNKCWDLHPELRGPLMLVSLPRALILRGPMSQCFSSQSPTFRS